MKINDSYALPTAFDVNVGMGDRSSITYKVELDVEKKILSVSVSSYDGVFTDAERQKGMDFIRDSVADGSLHLPTFIPMCDVEGAEQWDGFREWMEA
jgi:hypothetical protein